MIFQCHIEIYVLLLLAICFKDNQQERKWNVHLVFLSRMKNLFGEYTIHFLHLNLHCLLIYIYIHTHLQGGQLYLTNWQFLWDIKFATTFHLYDH